MSKTRIIESVRHLDLEETREILTAQPSLAGVTDRQGRTLLHLACSASPASLKVPETAAARMVTFLLDRGLDPDAVVVMDDYPCNAVWFAVARGRSPAVVKLLLKRGATPRGLFAAGWYNDTGMLDVLIRAGAAVDEHAEDETPFLHCWKNRRFESARLLVRRGADVNFQDSKGRTALHYGIAKDFDPALLEFLVKSGASPDLKDRDGVSPMMMASRKRDRKFVEALA